MRTFLKQIANVLYKKNEVSFQRLNNRMGTTEEASRITEMGDKTLFAYVSKTIGPLIFDNK